MTKAECLRMMCLLSALESVMLSHGPIPDYLREALALAVESLQREILKEPA